MDDAQLMERGPSPLERLVDEIEKHVNRLEGSANRCHERLKGVAPPEPELATLPVESGRLDALSHVSERLDRVAARVDELESLL